MSYRSLKLNIYKSHYSPVLNQVSWKREPEAKVTYQHSPYRGCNPRGARGRRNKATRGRRESVDKWVRYPADLRFTANFNCCWIQKDIFWEALERLHPGIVYCGGRGEKNSASYPLDFLISCLSWIYLHNGLFTHQLF